MNNSALNAGSPIVLLTVRDGIVDGCEHYAPGRVPVSIVVTGDQLDNARRMRNALATLPHVPASRA